MLKKIKTKITFKKQKNKKELPINIQAEKCLNELKKEKFIDWEKSSLFN